MRHRLKTDVQPLIVHFTVENKCLVVREQNTHGAKRVRPRNETFGCGQYKGTMRGLIWLGNHDMWGCNQWPDAFKLFLSYAVTDKFRP